MLFIYGTAVYVLVAVLLALLLRAKAQSASPLVRAAEDAEQMAAIRPRSSGTSRTREPIATLH